MIPAEQRIAIRGASWKLYDEISEAIGERQRVFVAFDGKDIEILTKGPVREDLRHLVTDFLSIVPAACGIRSRKLGETTWKRRALERNLEADQCVFFDSKKLTAVANALKSQSNDLAKYPNPDLAVEIDLSPSKVDRPGIYASLEIPEVWRCNGEQVVFGQLRANGKYSTVKRSRWLPVRPEDVRRWLVDEDHSDDVEWKRKLSDWATGLASGGR
jgi:Uma2 family endonuclease